MGWVHPDPEVGIYRGLEGGYFDFHLRDLFTVFLALLLNFLPKPIALRLNFLPKPNSLLVNFLPKSNSLLLAFPLARL